MTVRAKARERGRLSTSVGRNGPQGMLGRPANWGKGNRPFSLSPSVWEAATTSSGATKAGTLPRCKGTKQGLGAQSKPAASPLKSG